MTLRITDYTTNLAEALKSLAGMQVMVGVPSEKADRRQVPGEEPVNNAQLAYIHERGAPERGIPARPFLVPGIKGAQEKILGHLRFAALAALDGDKLKMLKGLNRAGLVAQAAVRRKIDSGPFQPLKPATLYARKHRKHAPRMGEEILKDKGEMRNSISYVIVKGQS